MPPIAGRQYIIDTEANLLYNIENETWEVFMKRKDIHILIAMFATLASMFTVITMIFMRFLG